MSNTTVLYGVCHNVKKENFNDTLQNHENTTNTGAIQPFSVVKVMCILLRVCWVVQDYHHSSGHHAMTKNWDEFKYEVKRSKVKVIVDDNAARGLGNRLW